jgi:gluconokinase
MSAPPQHVIVMGVSGSGKTTVASLLAARLGWVWAEADDFHPPSNIEKMAAGHPLDDEDRWPWLRALRDWLTENTRAGQSSVVSCSALKTSYRDVLREAEGRVRFVHLSGSQGLIGSRLAARTRHFMPAVLLPSQLAALQPLGEEEDGFAISVDESPEVLVGRIIELLAVRPPSGRG